MMAHRIDASYQLLLPDTPNDMAACLAEVAKAWTVFTASLEPYQAQTTFSVTEVRTSTRISKRGRKPRLVPVNPPEAA